tara:strand:- start:303 stop:452 length:150 start_codon:yes stop_codon:yes gene_type:complete
MSKFIIKIALKRELEKLNKIIDRKILSGQSYKKESLLHKALRKQIQAFN